MSDYGGVEFICGGCGKREAGWFNSRGDACKPEQWYRRGDGDGIQLACSRRCIDTISAKSGKTNAVFPL